MQTKTRYLQLNDIVMFEYRMNSAEPDTAGEPVSFIMSELSDKHISVFTPIKTEVKKSDDKYIKKQLSKVTSFNNMNHLAVPKDSNGSFFYTFMDNSYEYVNDSNVDSLNENDLKVKSYAEFCSNLPGEQSTFKYVNFQSSTRYDTIRLYFVNGYDFSGIYGMYLRVYIPRNDGKYLDLCDFFITKSSYFKMTNFLMSPVIFGNAVYDRYIDISVPCIYDIKNHGSGGIDTIFDIKYDEPVKINFSTVSETDHAITRINANISDIIYGSVINDNVNCTFIKTTNLNGAIPSETISSDSLGLYIAEHPEYPYIEFYGTWNDKPLSFNIVQSFNRSIPLYSTALIKKVSEYEVDSEFTPDINLNKWVVSHEIRTVLMNNDTIKREEKYNMSQVFIDPNDKHIRFFYRPVMFDNAECNDITAIIVEYTMRFMNIIDKVQFVKTATLSLTNISKFFSKGQSITGINKTPYKVYNKIEEKTGSIINNAAGTNMVKYIKVFYNSTDVMLNADGYNTGTNMITLSKMPKNYKFNIKKASNGKTVFFDMTNCNYKLAVYTNSSDYMLVEPTYSTNMNLIIGEIEFYINQDMISKMTDTDDNNKIMSIVAYNEDGSISSLVDFKFSF